LQNFSNTPLYFIQGRDNETWIALTKSLNTIHALYGRDTEVPGGGEVDPEVAIIYDFLLVLHSMLFCKIKKSYVCQVVKSYIPGSEELCVR
jgi:hypothetical protein